MPKQSSVIRSISTTIHRPTRRLPTVTLVSAITNSRTIRILSKQPTILSAKIPPTTKPTIAKCRPTSSFLTQTTMSISMQSNLLGFHQAWPRPKNTTTKCLLKSTKKNGSKNLKRIECSYKKTSASFRILRGESKQKHNNIKWKAEPPRTGSNSGCRYLL